MTTVTRATGPVTEAGKATVSQNAVKDGLFSARPVIRGAESDDEWLAFRDSIVASLHPEHTIQLAPLAPLAAPAPPAKPEITEQSP